MAKGIVNLLEFIHVNQQQVPGILIPAAVYFGLKNWLKRLRLLSPVMGSKDIWVRCIFT